MGRSALTCCSPLCTNRPLLLEQRKYKLDGAVRVLSDSGPQQRELREFCAFVAGWYDKSSEALEGLGEDGSAVKREDFKQYAAKIGFVGDGGIVFDAIDVEGSGALPVHALRSLLLETIASLSVGSRPSSQSRGPTNRSLSREQKQSTPGSGPNSAPNSKRKSGTKTSKDFKEKGQRTSIAMDGEPPGSPAETSPGGGGTGFSRQQSDGGSTSSQTKRPKPSPSREQTEASTIPGEGDALGDKGRMNGVAEASTRSSLHQADGAARAAGLSMSPVPSDGKDIDQKPSRKSSKLSVSEGGSDAALKLPKGVRKGRRASKDKLRPDGTESMNSLESFQPSAASDPLREATTITENSGPASSPSDAMPPDASAEMPVMQAPLAVADTDGIPKVDTNRFVNVRPHPYKRCDPDEVDERERPRSFVFKGRLFEVPLLPLYELDEDRKDVERAAKGTGWNVAKSKVLGQNLKSLQGGRAPGSAQ